MRAGTLGYVLKGAAPGDMIRAIAAVAAGQVSIRAEAIVRARSAGLGE